MKKVFSFKSSSASVQVRRNGKCFTDEENIYAEISGCSTRDVERFITGYKMVKGSLIGLMPWASRLEFFRIEKSFLTENLD